MAEYLDPAKGGEEGSAAVDGDEPEADADERNHDAGTDRLAQQRGATDEREALYLIHISEPTRPD